MGLEAGATLTLRFRCLLPLPRFVFVHMNPDDAEEKLTAAQEEVDQDVVALEGEMGEVRSKMDELKTTLYSKFGNTINLEDD